MTCLQLEHIQRHASNKKAAPISLELLQCLLNLLSAAPEVSARGVSAPFLLKIADIFNSTCPHLRKPDPQVQLHLLSSLSRCAHSIPKNLEESQWLTCLHSRLLRESSQAIHWSIVLHQVIELELNAEAAMEKRYDYTCTHYQPDACARMIV